MRRLLKLALSASVFATAVATSGAAAAPGGGVETVVVTAERRQEALFDVPATVTAISGDQLRNLGVVDMKSIVQMVPNAVLPDDPENFETFINIRGVHQADINAEPNFGLYRNGMYAGGERANLGAQIDIERVEVLSGPQSGLYGRDAVGGVVNVIFKTPTMDSLGGYAIASYNSFERSELQGAINIPITDNFAVRATGWWINQDQGQLYNIFLKQYIDRNRDLGGRFSARWDATSDLSFVWMAEIQDRHGPSYTAYAPNGLGNTFNVRCCGLLVSPPETLKTISQNTPDTEHWQQTFLSQDVNFDTKSWAGTLELLASYRNYHLSLQEDQDHTAFSASDGPMAQDSIQFRHESMNNFFAELLWRSPEDQPLTWIAGVDYFNEKFRFDRVFVGKTDFNLLSQPAFGPFFTYGNLYCAFLMAGNPAGSYDGGCEGTPGLAPGLPGAGVFGSFPYIFPSIGVQSSAAAFGAPGSFVNTESEAAFASVTYKFTDELSIRGDLRWDQTRKSLNYIQGAVGGYGQTALGASYLVPLFYQIFFPYHSAQNNTFNNLAPSATLQYKVSPTINLYATYATGFRAGGYNLGTSTPAFLPYKPEKNANYEVGAKTVWLDGRLNINGDVFYMTQSDLVEPQADPAEPSFIGLYYLANVGNARTWGAELSALYQPIDWLGLGLSVGWLDDKFTKGFSNATSIVGQEIPLTRNWTINMTADVDYPLTSDVDLIGNMNWRLEYGGWLPAFAPPTFALETVRYKDLNKLDLDAGVAFGQTRIVGFVNNAFDDVIPQFEYTATTVNVSEGLTYGIRIEQRF